MRNTRTSCKKIINKYFRSGITKKPLVRLQGMLALVSFVFSILSTSLFFLPNTLYAQDPIYPIGLTGGGATGNPTLQLENYDAAGMEAFFQDANAQAGDVDSWIALVVNNVGMQRAAWESDADMQIQAYIDNLNVSDNYNGVANYRDALLKELNSQKEAALQIWERTANTDIYLQLENYLTNLTGGIYDDAVGNTDSSLSNTNGISQNTRLTPEQIQQQFNQSRQQWETQFQDSTDKGLKEYGDSLTAINDNYNRFVDQLDSADVNFQQNLQAIQDYKQNVISGISSTVDNLKGFLDNSANESLFGTASSRLPAGTELQALIDKFTTKIASMGTNDFSLILTQLASDMTNYLDKQVNLTTVTRNNYQKDTYTNYVNNDPTGNANMNDRTGSTIFLNGINLKPPLVGRLELVDRIADYINGKISGNTLQWIYNNSEYYGQAFGYGKYDANGNPPATGKVITSIFGANLYGYSFNPPGPPYWGAWGMNQNYAQNNEAFTWFGAYKPGGADQFGQETFSYKISYQVTDFTAKTNADTFTGFVNQLSAQFSSWQNNLIPAISNWESQAANYKNFYDQWKGNADTLRTNAKTEYEASVAKVESDRSKWLVAMETEKKEADKQWDALASKIDTSNMTGRDLSALLSQTPSTNGLAVNSPNALADNFNTSLQNLQNTKFTFNSTDYKDEIAGYRSSGQPVVKSDFGIDFSALNKLTALQTVKSFLTDPFSTQSSYSIFNPEIKAPDTSVTGINLDKAFTNSFNGVQNMAYVTGTTDAADKIAKDYYDSIVNQYKFNFKEEVMYDRRMKAAINAWNADAANANNQIELKVFYDFKEEQKRIAEFQKNNPGKKITENAQIAAWNARKNSKGDLDLLSAAEKDAYEKGRCYTDVATNCGGFMEVNKDLKSITVENGQIVIKREISDGTIHKGGGDKDYELVGGYSSGKQIDVIRVNMAKMGVIIQNPKDLFTEWSNEDYNAIADNLNTKANELYASAEKDSKAITSGITDSVKRGEHFMSIAMGAAQKAVAQDQMMQSIAQAYLTGGMAGIQQMVKDKIRDAFIDKVAEATGINPDLVRFASGRFEQAKLNKKMNSQAGGLGSGAGAVMGAGLMMAMGPVGPLMMAGPLGATALGAGAGAKLGSKMISGGTMANLVNNPMVQAGITAVAGPVGGMMVNKALQKTSFVQNNNQLNALKQQENALIQDAAGQAVANAIGRPDAAGNFSQILGGLKKRQVAKRDNANLGKVATKGIASALNMGSGMIKGIVKNAVIAVGGSGDTFDQLTASPFTPPATWTGAAKVDMSKEGWKSRLEEKAMADFLEANGMDRSLATTVASTTNAKIKAKKAKKEEKTKAIESTAQTALAITAIVLTGGAAGPALGSVLTGGASGTFYAVQGANIALQAAIGSRTGGPQGALAGVVNGTLQAVAATNFGKLAEGADKLLDKADEIQTMAINNPLIAKTMAATNVSYSKENGWGIKANLSGVVNALGVRGGVNFERFTNVTIGQSQRGGASVNLGFNTGKGTLGVNYTGATGKFDGSFDVKELQSGTGKLSAELNYGEDGFSVSGNADLGNGLGFGLESGRNGMSGSLTILGSTQGTVDGDGNYEANGNFLGEISGQDIIDLNKARADQRLAEENERNPAKSAKDAKNAKDAADAKEARDDDAKEVGGEEGPSGLVDLAFAGLGVVMSAGAAFLAGGGSSSASPSGSAGGQSGAGNGSNAFGRKPEDEKDGKVKGDGDTKDEPPKKQPTKEELANFKDNIFWNTTRAATDAYLDKLDKQGVDTKEMRAHAEAQRASGVRDLTAGEIKVKRLNKELNDLKIELDKASTIAQDNGLQTEGMNPLQQQAQRREEIKQKIADKEKEVAAQKDVVAREANVVKPVKDGLDIGGVGAVMLAGIIPDAKKTPVEILPNAIEAGIGKGSTMEKVLNLFSMNGYKSNGEVALSRILEPDSIFTKIKNAVGLGNDINLRVGDSAIIRKRGEKEITVMLDGGKEQFILSGSDDLKRIINAAGGYNKINSASDFTSLINKGLSNYEASIENDPFIKDRLNGGTTKVGDNNANYREGVHYAFELDPQKRGNEVMNIDYQSEPAKVDSLRRRPDGTLYSLYDARDGKEVTIKFMDKEGIEVKIIPKGKDEKDYPKISFDEYFKSEVDTTKKIKSEAIAQGFEAKEDYYRKSTVEIIQGFLVDELDCGPATKVNALKEAGILRPDMTLYQAEQIFGTEDWKEMKKRGNKEGGFLNIALEKSDWAKLNGKYKDKDKFAWENFGSFEVNHGSINLLKNIPNPKLESIKRYIAHGGVVQVNGTVNEIAPHFALVLNDTKDGYKLNDSFFPYRDPNSRIKISKKVIATYSHGIIKK